jgi:hypothetical protein
MIRVDPTEVRLNFFLWVEVNHRPYQLLINPELNLIGASHLPFFSRPDPAYIEPQIYVPRQWMNMVPEELAMANQLGISTVPFVSRAIPSMWIPNPLISRLNDGLYPSWILCVYGEAVLRIPGEGDEICGKRNFFKLPINGIFHIKFLNETLFVLGFK